MKKLLLVIVTVLGFASLGTAQKFSIGGALNVSAGTGTGTAVEGSILLGVRDIARLLIVGVDARFEGNLAIGNGSTGFSVGAAALGTLNVGIVTAYAGPQVVYVLAPTVADPLRFGAIIGARYDLILGLSAFGEVNILFTNPVFWRLRVGATFTL
jgi:hypothetical protein